MREVKLTEDQCIHCGTRMTSDEVEYLTNSCDPCEAAAHEAWQAAEDDEPQDQRATWTAPICVERQMRPVTRREAFLRPVHRRYLRRLLGAGASTAGQVGMDKSIAEEMCREGYLKAEHRQWGRRTTTAYAITPAGRLALAAQEGGRDA